VDPFESVLPPDLYRLRGLRKDLSAWLDSVGVANGDRDAVVLAAHEAAANGIEHACGLVTVRGARQENRLVLVVSNSGRWKGEPSQEHRGHGLTLMRTLMSRLEIHVEPDRTTVRMGLDL
jgi:serine/threonine-protein kinase RsbW